MSLGGASARSAPGKISHFDTLFIVSVSAFIVFFFLISVFEREIDRAWGGEVRGAEGEKEADVLLSKELGACGGLAPRTPIS